MKPLLVVVALLACCYGCVPSEVTKNRQDHEYVNTVYVWDAFGECYALVSGGFPDARQQHWIHMKPEACQR